MSECEALCEICGNKYNNYMRTMYIQYSKNDNDRKCTCLECWRKEAIVKPYRYTNEIPMSCDGGDFITRVFNTKEDLLQYVLDNTDDGYIACMDDDDNTRLVPISGTPIDLLHMPPGCPFAPRCDKAMQICLKERAREYWVGRDHLSACWQNIKDGICSEERPEEEEEEA